jgi:hypothetical protein
MSHASAARTKSNRPIVWIDRIDQDFDLDDGDHDYRPTLPVICEMVARIAEGSYRGDGMANDPVVRDFVALVRASGCRAGECRAFAVLVRASGCRTIGEWEAWLSKNGPLPG